MRNQFKKTRGDVFKCVRRFLPDILRRRPTLDLSSIYLSKSVCHRDTLMLTQLYALDGVKIFILYTFAFLANSFSALREKKRKFLQRYLKTKFLPMMNSR